MSKNNDGVGVALVVAPDLPTGVLVSPMLGHGPDCECGISPDINFKVTLAGAMNVEGLMVVHNLLGEIISRMSVTDPETGEIVAMPV